MPLPRPSNNEKLLCEQNRASQERMFTALDSGALYPAKLSASRLSDFADDIENFVISVPETDQPLVSSMNAFQRPPVTGDGLSELAASPKSVAAVSLDDARAEPGHHRRRSSVMRVSLDETGYIAGEIFRRPTNFSLSVDETGLGLSEVWSSLDSGTSDARPSKMISIDEMRGSMEGSTRQSKATDSLDSLSFKTTALSAGGFRKSSVTKLSVDDLVHDDISLTDSGQLICTKCQQVISGLDPILFMHKQPFHDSCVTCAGCEEPLSGQLMETADGECYCSRCYDKRIKPMCALCNEPIKDAFYSTMDKKFHPACLECAEPDCGPITTNFHSVQNRVYCTTHFRSYFVCQCKVCCLQLVKTQAHVKIGSYAIHTDCWKCEFCADPIGTSGSNQRWWREKLLCQTCDRLPAGKLREKLFPEEMPPLLVNVKAVNEPAFDQFRLQSKPSFGVSLLIHPRVGLLAEFLTVYHNVASIGDFQALPHANKVAVVTEMMMPFLRTVEAYHTISEEEQSEVQDDFTSQFIKFADGVSLGDYEDMLKFNDAGEYRRSSSISAVPLAASQAFLKRCIEDPSLLNEFDTLTSSVKEVILDRFVEQTHGSLQSFKSLDDSDQHSLLSDLIKHNVQEIEQFNELSKENQNAFMDALATENIKYLKSLSEPEYAKICDSAAKKYGAFRAVLHTTPDPPRKRTPASGGPYSYQELRYTEFLPADVPVDQREKYLTNADFEKFFGMTKKEFSTLRVWRQRTLKIHVCLF